MIRASFRTVIILGLVSGALLCRGAEAQRTGVVREKPLRWQRPPRVVSMIFRPDGKRLAASYYAGPINRPGTDWNAAVAQWNVETGKALIVPNAFHPLAFSPDGQRVAMGVVDRRRNRYFPHARIGLFKAGETEPFREFKPPQGDDSPVLAATFWRDGKRVLGLNGSGKALVWHTDRDAPAKVMDDLKTGRIGLRQGRGRRRHPAPGMAFGVGRGVLATFHVYLTSDGQYVGGRAVLWQYNPGFDSLHRIRVYEGGLITRDARSVDAIGMGIGAYRPGWAYPFAYLKDADLHRCQVRFDPIAFFAKKYWIAFSAHGKVAIRTYDGRLVKQFPFGDGAVKFNHDGSLLAAADGKGTIRIWNVQSGKLVHTLKLEGDAAVGVRK